MRNIVGLIAVLSLVAGMGGAWAFGQLSGSTGTAGAAPTAQQVREQNLDGSGFIRTHEQGTANVAGTVNIGNLPATQNVNVVSTPSPAAGRLISLGTQTIAAGGRYRSGFVDKSDCNKATAMTTVYPWEFSWGTPGFYVNLQMSPDGVQAISANGAGSPNEDVIDGVKTRSVNNIQVVWPFMRVEAYLGPTGDPTPASTITAWIWCEP